MARTTPHTRAGGDDGGSGAHLLVVADRLAGAFLAGQTDAPTAAALHGLLPGAAFLSLSMFVGGKLLVSEHNLMRAGYVDVAFDDLERTAAGRAMATGACVQVDAAEAGTCADFARAATSGCDCLFAAPIVRRPRRSSADEPRPAAAGGGGLKPLMARRNSESDGGKLRAPPLGALTLGMRAGTPLLALQRLNLAALADHLVPLLGSYGYAGAGPGLDMESLFGQSDEPASPDAAGHDSDASELAAWDSGSSVEDFVDSLIYRQDGGSSSHRSSTSSSGCGRPTLAPADAADCAVEPQMPPPLEEPVLALA